MTHPTSTVAVVTATIGRDDLLKAIKSVQAQTYPCKHYIFVDGEQFHDKVKNLLKDDYPDVVVTYLPMNTGANKMYNSYINAIAPFLVKEDIICYLDDDNWYDKEHVESLVSYMDKYQADYGYSLRYFVNGNDIWKDNTESLGFWYINPKDLVPSAFVWKNNTYQVPHGIDNYPNAPYLIDVNCYAIRRHLAIDLAKSWAAIGLSNDRVIANILIQYNFKGICTSKRTVYYQYAIPFNINLELMADIVGLDYPFTISQEEISQLKLSLSIHTNNHAIEPYYHQKYGTDHLPWERPTLREHGTLTPIPDLYDKE
ncbi:glycosyltransferase family 2 protein [Moraxella oblonga]|uniref:glycosyltransferase family 2 protein n=1 Tax=Moraxella oblonga TaxID=200413 RepID=UPI00083255F7|nr:glycosyltransferase family 2 protein [Moraxella oblonga]